MRRNGAGVVAAAGTVVVGLAASAVWAAWLGWDDRYQVDPVTRGVTMGIEGFSSGPSRRVVIDERRSRDRRPGGYWRIRARCAALQRRTRRYP
jgi:hypothetical protein